MNSMVNEVAISRLHWPVTTLGHGERIGIWFQGCTIHCKDCCSHDTWAVDPDKLITIERLIDWVAGQPLSRIDGLTISGGEPFDQADSLQEVIEQLRSLFSESTKPIDILVYSGYPWRRIQEKHATILKHIDALISEPFVASRPVDWLRGSSNQTIHCLTPLGRQRYGDSRSIPNSKSLQLCYDGNAIWMIGIPQRGDLDELRRILMKSGISLGKLSWIA
ncbi:MAG TPA: radical SAM protein [Gammaproteobacteria bacterium]|nr:radical SAM protein [Gammaproteobacteria bacterium]